MSSFIVTTHESVAGTYRVEAASAEEARAMLDHGPPFPWGRIEQLDYMAFDSEVEDVTPEPSQPAIGGRNR